MTIAQFAHKIFGSIDDDSGQGLMEYALILTLVAVACIGVLGVLATSVGDSLIEFVDLAGFNGS